MIQLDRLSIRSGPFTLSDINLLVPTGQYAVLMGATGQGKTTILEAICGLRTVTGGRVLLGGVDMTRLKPSDRGVGYLPQDLGLFPTMTVRGHLEFALRVRRTPRKTINERVAEVASLLGIEPLLARHVGRLSGGEAQRVALGRALAFRPQLLLFDEPLNALDEATRDRLCALLRKIQSQTRVTTLHITHTRAEARQLADKLIILKDGRLEERPLSELEHLPEEMLEPPPRERPQHAAGQMP
jgi:ABC-type sugar transport system ATPase subunit